MVDFSSQALAQALRRGSGQSSPQRFIGQAALANALNPGPIHHPLQGASQLANAFVGARLLNKADRADQERREGVQSTLADALRASRETPQVATQDALAAELGGGGSGLELREGSGFQETGALPGGLDALIETLGGNPDTAGLGLELQLDQLLQGPGQGFTLGEGQTRFGPGGEVIAKGRPKSAEQFEDVFDGQGNRIGQRNVRTNRFHTIDREGGDRDLTNKQLSDNIEIDAARGRILRLQNELQPGETLQDLILRLTEKTTNTGRQNPDFNPLVERDLRLASNRKVGEDAGFETFFNTLEVAAPTPDPGPTPVEPAPADQEFGFLDRLFGGNQAFGSTSTRPSGPDQSPAPNRSPRGRSDFRSPRAVRASIEAMSLEDIDELVASQGDSLSPADLQRIEARLNALNRTPSRRLPR